MKRVLQWVTVAVVVAMGLPAIAVAQDAGADIFKLRCAMCHGADGTANTPAGKVFKAASFKDPAIIKIPDEERAAIVKKGKNKMPSFADKLTDEQIKSVLEYIHTLEK